MKFWVDDRLVDAGEARISVLDHGFTVADGVFETLKVVDGAPFALTRHLRRLAASAEGLGLWAPDLDTVREAVMQVCAVNAAAVGPLGRLRITFTAGSSTLGSDRGSHGPTLVVAMGEGTSWPPSTSVMVAPWPRNERSPVAGIKSTSYVENVVALAAAKAAGAGEAIFGNTVGALCEGTGTNVFVVQGGRVLTPPLSSGALGGITRELVLEWCDAQEWELGLDVLSESEEVFLTSSTRDIQPVHAVFTGDADIRLAVPGVRTSEVAAIFAERAAADIDP